MSLSIQEKYPLVSQTTGYDIFDEHRNKVNYDEYHGLICREISRGNAVGVDSLIRWIDVAGYFPDYCKLFRYAAVHGTISMYLMIYYMILFWNEEQSIPTFGESFGILDDGCIDVDEKRDFLLRVYVKYKSLTYYKNEDEKEEYDNDNECKLFQDALENKLIKYGINMRDINKSFWKNCEDKYDEMSP